MPSKNTPKPILQFMYWCRSSIWSVETQAGAWVTTNMISSQFKISWMTRLEHNPISMGCCRLNYRHTVFMRVVSGASMYHLCFCHNMDWTHFRWQWARMGLQRISLYEIQVGWIESGKFPFLLITKTKACKLQPLIIRLTYFNPTPPIERWHERAIWKTTGNTWKGGIQLRRWCHMMTEIYGLQGLIDRLLSCQANSHHYTIRK